MERIGERSAAAGRGAPRGTFPSPGAGPADAQCDPTPPSDGSLTDGTISCRPRGRSNITAARARRGAGEIEALQTTQYRTSFNEDIVDEIRRNGGVYVKRRHDGRVLAHTILPKILKTDIRRSFPQIFVNVYNSGNVETFQQFLHTFGDCNLRFSHFLTDPAMCFDQKLEMIGHHGVLAFWSRLLFLVPDATGTMEGAKVTARSDGTGLVKLSLAIRGTIVLNDYRLHDGTVAALGRGGAGDCADGALHESLMVCALLAQVGGLGGLTSIQGVTTTHSVYARGELSLHLDADNRVSAVDMTMNPVLQS